MAIGMDVSWILGHFKQATLNKPKKNLMYPQGTRDLWDISVLYDISCIFVKGLVWFMSAVKSDVINSHRIPLHWAQQHYIYEIITVHHTATTRQINLWHLCTSLLFFPILFSSPLFSFLPFSSLLFSISALFKHL